MHCEHYGRFVRAFDAHPGAPLKWTLFRLRAEPVTHALAQSGLHGHKSAIDAMLCATALAQPGRVTILTPDVEDISMLTADHPHMTTEKI